jgi:hypothetical protein
MTKLRSGLFIAVIAGGCTMAAAAFAQAPGSTTGTGIDARETTQQRRIQQGINSGALTPGEAARLERREMSIERQEQRMRARDGGELTTRDRAILNHRLDRTSGAIYRAKHNNRRAY